MGCDTLGSFRSNLASGAAKSRIPDNSCDHGGVQMEIVRRVRERQQARKRVSAIDLERESGLWIGKTEKDAVN